MTRRLVLLRHGRTAWNHARRVQGQLDPPLDDVGLQQAAAVGPRLASLEPSVLWTSDLTRTVQTSAAVEAATGLAARHDKRLREFSLGEREGLTHEEFAEVAPDEFARFRLGQYDTVPGAERVADIEARMGSALRELLQSLRPDETGVAVTHGGVTRVAVGLLAGWPTGLFHTLQGLDNCGWVELEERTDADDLRVVAYNRTA